MSWIPVVICFVPALGYATWVHLKTERAMRRYWDRPSTTLQWQMTFPDTDPQDIRAFLQVFNDALAFSRKRVFCFEPRDRLCEVYDALYICGSRGAGGEMTALYLLLERRYKVRLSVEGFEKRSLEELFRLIVSAEAKVVRLVLD